MDKEKTEERVQRAGTERETGSDRDSLVQTDGLMDWTFTSSLLTVGKVKNDRTIPESDRQSSHFGKVTDPIPVILGMPPPLGFLFFRSPPRCVWADRSTFLDPTGQLTKTACQTKT